MKNAIILAAGKSNRFAPFTYEKPKGLFTVKGEILIERQIEQLIAAGVEEIAVIIGFMKEKFFYLENKYRQVKLIVNNKFEKYGNLYSLYIARDFLKNTFICCADHYFTENPFIDGNIENRSYRACVYYDRSFREFSVDYTDADVISNCYFGNSSGTAMVGHAYFNENFSRKYRELMEKEINGFRIANMFWEEFFGKHIKELTLYVKLYSPNEILEFDDVEDLRRFDSDFLLNVDSQIVNNICGKLGCNPNKITDISVIQSGLTNVSFKFSVDGTVYVYRHPGGTAGNLIDRKTEITAQTAAKDLGIDKSVIYIDPTGWKLSYYIDNIVPCDFLKNPDQLKIGMEYLRKFHNAKITGYAKVFDDVKEGKRLMELASATKGNLFTEFGTMLEKLDKLKAFADEESEKLGIKKVLCHNDVYEPNFIATADGDLYLIDWEYAGLNDPVSDICGLICRYEYTKEDVSRLLRAYYGREITKTEERHAYAYIAFRAFYFFCWSLYKGSVGEEDGFFFLTVYRNITKYADIALEKYRETKK